VLPIGRTELGTPTSALLISPEVRTQPVSISLRGASAPHRYQNFLEASP
jgi:hypothetical protein